MKRCNYIRHELYHHGILGQKWGVQNGPPYPLKGEQYSHEEKREAYKRRKDSKKGRIYNKKHFDNELTTKDTITTLSYDPDRTKKGGMFYAAYKPIDKHQYNALFNTKVDIDGVYRMKYRIDNNVKDHMKVASEDSAANTFMKLYSSDRDFCNYVKDENRMEKYFDKTRFRFKGYSEARDVLHKIREEGHTPSEKELNTIYRLFNYVIPYDGGGQDVRGAKDNLNNRNKFFNELKKEGYGAVLDTNDALYGGYKGQYPIIVFDMDQIIPDKIKETNMLDKRVSQLAFVGSKMLGM